MGPLDVSDAQPSAMRTKEDGKTQTFLAKLPSLTVSIVARAVVY